MVKETEKKETIFAHDVSYKILGPYQVYINVVWRRRGYK